MVNSLVSVIIPTYNRAEQVVEAVNSVLQQTYTAFELIVVDDASTDSTISLLRKEFAADTRVELIFLSENKGVSFARNRGIEMAKGEWIAFLDSDDIWHKDKLQQQVAYIKENPQYKIVQTQEIWIREGVRVNAPKTHRKRDGDIFAASLKRCMITPSSVMIHRSLFDKYGTFNETFPACEDYDLWLRISAFEKVGLVDKLLMTRYGGAEDQLSYTVQLQDIYRIKSIKQIIDAEILTGDKRTLAIKTMVKKCKILANGALKRGKSERYFYYIDLFERYSKI